MNYIEQERQGRQGKIEASIKIAKTSINDKRIMGEDSLRQLCTWVDADIWSTPRLKNSHW